MINKIKQYIQNQIDTYKAEKLKAIINTFISNKYDIVYIGRKKHRNSNANKVLDQFPYLKNDQEMNALLINKYQDIYSILYAYHGGKKELIEEINNKKFHYITNAFTKIKHDFDYSRILLTAFIKHVGLENTFDPMLQEYSQYKFFQNEGKFISEEENTRQPHFNIKLVTDIDESITIISNAHIISSPWSSDRLADNRALSTFKSITQKGYLQESNHQGYYISNLHTLFISNGNHSNAIGNMMNIDMTYTVNEDIRAYKFNDNLYKATFSCNRVMLDGVEYISKDWRKNAIYKIAQIISIYEQRIIRTT